MIKAVHDPSYSSRILDNLFPFDNGPVVSKIAKSQRTVRREFYPHLTFEGLTRSLTNDRPTNSKNEKNSKAMQSVRNCSYEGFRRITLRMGRSGGAPARQKDVPAPTVLTQKQKGAVNISKRYLTVQRSREDWLKCLRPRRYAGVAPIDGRDARRKAKSTKLRI